MDERMRELIAIGASAAVNCHPCMRHHLAKCEALAVSHDDVVAAAQVGMMVNRGAANKTRGFVGELLGADMAKPHGHEKAAAGGSGA